MPVAVVYTETTRPKFQLKIGSFIALHQITFLSNAQLPAGGTEMGDGGVVLLLGPLLCGLFVYGGQLLPVGLLVSSTVSRAGLGTGVSPAGVLWLPNGGSMTCVVPVGLLVSSIASRTV